MNKQVKNTKFFTNNSDNTLFDKLKGIAASMTELHSFLAVVGYFRSSGYFKLREELSNVEKIKILVGIDTDSLLKKYQSVFFNINRDKEFRDAQIKQIRKDIREAKYSAEVEKGILQFIEDQKSGKLELRIHQSQKLHAKFYLCLPKDFSPHSDGWVIMGSSNISDAGLGITKPPQYELNVAMKDYDEVAYCKHEFDQLWNEGIEFSAEDMQNALKQTHLGVQATPYEIFIKVLIDAFGTQVEDKFSLELPKEYKPLKYQNDAVIQAFQILKRYNGVLLADVVGLGKTIIATMLAKRFIEENGKPSNILVVYPPAVEANWHRTFKDFKITEHAEFVTNGSLQKIIDRSIAGKFDLVIVDEAHGFRYEQTDRYDLLQKICKTPRSHEGAIAGDRKKVVLISATPLNNGPADIYNLIQLFQDRYQSTIEDMPDFATHFEKWIRKYKDLRSSRSEKKEAEIAKEVDKLYEQMRLMVLDKLLLRRTRSNLLNNPEYKKDLENQKITIPKVEPPQECKYKLGDKLATLFEDTVTILSDIPSDDKPHNSGLHFACYRTIEYITNEQKKARYPQTKQNAEVFSTMLRVGLIKRLESSFAAFRGSLESFRQKTKAALYMWKQNTIVIDAKTDVKGMLAKGISFDEIFEKINKARNRAEKKRLGNPEDYQSTRSREDVKKETTYVRADFDPKYKDLLEEDLQKIENLIEKWRKVNTDPKYNHFKKRLTSELMQKTRRRKDDEEVEFNREGKLVIFSESIATVEYLAERLKQDSSEKVLVINSKNNSKQLAATVRDNFDANVKEKKNDYNIIITTEVLAEVSTYTEPM